MTTRSDFMRELAERAGQVRPVGDGRSLFEVGGAALVYVRYSKLHGGKKGFFGLREVDIRAMQGRDAFIALIWDGQVAPLFLPLADFNDVLRDVGPAADGQFKVQVYTDDRATEFYVARAGRFNVAGYFGWEILASSLAHTLESTPELGHHQVQTLLGAIGHSQGMSIWVPPNDQTRLDWELAPRFEPLRSLPPTVTADARYVQEIDVMWVRPGTQNVEALYEVEHSTPIYSGLLRFNDFLLSSRSTARLTIVSNDTRREDFVRQVRRPTFRASGLDSLCGFMSYADVYRWFHQAKVSRGG